MKYCEHCHGPLQTEEISWRIKFLATVVCHLHKFEIPLTEDERCGFMHFLYDIAGMICPEEEKAEGKGLLDQKGE